MNLHCTVSGDGPPVVLLHGLFGRSQNLGTLARRLAAHFKVISLDLRNHGASPHKAGMSYVAMAGDVLETLGDLGALPAPVVGHSMGGKTAMVMALTRPEMVSRVVVADIAPISYRHSNRAVAMALQGLRLTPGLTRAQAEAALAEAVPEPAVRSFLLQNLIVGQTPAWRIGLAEIAAGMGDIEGFPAFDPACVYGGPALFVRGGGSGYVKDSALPAIAALFPDFRLETLPEAGHWLHADKPEDFAEAVETFLRAPA